MSAQQIAASEDPKRAAGFDAPPPPRPPPPPRAATPMSEAQIHRQVTDGLAAAATLYAAVDGYIRTHRQLPTPSAIARDARFDPLESPTARVSLGNGAMVKVTLRGGPYDGEDIGWIPLLHAAQLSWVCTHGRVPPRYFDPSCR